MQTNRIVISTACNRGGLGKSTFFALLAQYFQVQGIPFHGFDLDGDHQSLSRLFPDAIELAPTGSEPVGDMLKVLRASVHSPITIVDPRAHLGEHLLEALRITEFSRYLSESGGQLWLAVFPSDDLEVMQNTDKVISALQGAAQYIIIRNRGRSPQTRMFDGSALEHDILALGGVSLEIPSLLGWARNHLAALEAEQERGISHLEAIKNMELRLDPMVRLVIEDWIRASFSNIERIAPRIIPSAYCTICSASQTPHHTPVTAKRGAKINRENL